VVPSGKRRPPTGRLTGLDGLRGVAVLAVVAFHFGASWLQGGFFGVDLFYVLSGFLITGLLLNEGCSTGHIDLRHFWARRARRLLPALLLLLLVVTWYVHFIATPGTYPDYRADALSALFYVSNWHQIAASTNYFVANGPVSPLTHCWSLAIEEQFYLVWPLLTVAILRCWAGARRTAAAMLWICLLGAAASAIEMGLLFSPNASTTRIYFGTDTHVQCLLVGAALASAMARTGRGGWITGSFPPLGAALQRLVGVAALLAAVALAVLANRLTGDSAFTYQGGFALAAVLMAVVILGVVQDPKGVVARALSLRALVGLGRISYGVYLWHFPLAIYLTPARTGQSGISLAALRLVTTIGVASASYFVVERPIMRGTLWRSARALVPAGVGTVAVAVVILGATVAPSASAATVTRYRPHPIPLGAIGAPVPPHTLIVLGDSTAFTLFWALAATAPKGTAVIDDSTFGCGLMIESAGAVFPPHAGPPALPACNENTPPGQQWPALDARAVAHTGPHDVVLFLAGHDDTTSALQRGRWTDILSNSFQAAELGNLQTLRAIATAHGAHLDLLTMACMDAAYPLGQNTLWPSDTAQRRNIYNGLLRETAAASPSTVSVIDYGSIVCPTGKFTENLDGVQVRSPDGIHTPAHVPGGSLFYASWAVASRFYAWISPRLWPFISVLSKSV
jgi:peptidoglycan/LPS O-acetylase OafA/YrhL